MNSFYRLKIIYWRQKIVLVKISAFLYISSQKKTSSQVMAPKKCLGINLKELTFMKYSIGLKKIPIKNTKSHIVIKHYKMLKTLTEI